MDVVSLTVKRTVKPLTGYPNLAGNRQASKRPQVNTRLDRRKQSIGTGAEIECSGHLESAHLQLSIQVNQRLTTFQGDSSCLSPRGFVDRVRVAASIDPHV